MLRCTAAHHENVICEDETKDFVQTRNWFPVTQFDPMLPNLSRGPAVELDTTLPVDIADVVDTYFHAAATDEVAIFMK